MPTQRTVLITGSSTGIGRAASIHLAARGWTVYAGVRKAADGEALARESAAIKPIIIDVADDASIAAAAQRLTSELGAAGLAGLVNNAGISVNGPVELLTREDWRRQYEVNVFGQVMTTRAMLPLLRTHVAATCPGAARIVMISSIAGRVGQPVLTPYSSSKFALESISDGLRLELASQGIRVSLVEPGAIQSDIWAKAQSNVQAMSLTDPISARYAPMIQGVAKLAQKAAADAIPASKVAEVIERCLTSSRPPIRQLVGRDAKIAATFKTILPTRMFDGAIAKAFGIKR